MNRSGLAIASLVHYFKIPCENILVVVDDINLPLGKLRFRANGSAGGHNGLKSILAELGSQDFQRLRLGVGRPPEGVDQADFVLSEFPDEDNKMVADMLAAAGSVVKLWLDLGLNAAMTAANR